MKSLIILALSAFAVAQTTTSTTTNTATTTTTVSPQQSCLSACNPGDVTCEAICVGVPHPGTAQVNLTTSCVAQCDQGDGSAAASQAYAACRNACISSYIITSGTAAPGGVYTTAGKSGSVSASTTGSASGSAASASSSGSSSTSKAFAAPTIAARVGAAGGSLGLILAAFALL